ncbi:MAG: FtsQ-type POTRA domain-containing protein [Patescibacteria group bacterium]
MRYKSYAALGPKQKRRWWRRFAPVVIRERQAATARRGSRRTAVVFIALSLILGAWAGLLLFHPYFHIRNIIVTGTQNITETALQDTVTTALSRKRWYVVPHNNFFALDKKRLATILKTKYPVETVVVKTQFPDAIRITVTERLAFVIYDDGEQYTLVDEEGVPQKTLRAVAVHERKEQTRVGEGGRTATTTVHYPDVVALNARFGAYPVLYVQRKEKIDPMVIKSVIKIFTYLSQHTDFATHHFIYPNEYQTLQAAHRDGITVSFNPFEKLDEQLETFRQAWQRELRKERARTVYINARYPGRVYLEEGGVAAPPKTDR